VARGFEGGASSRPETYPSIPILVSPQAYGEAPQQSGTARDAELRSKCHAGATADSDSKCHGKSAPLALAPSLLRTKGTKGTKAPARLLWAAHAALPELLTPAQVAAYLGTCRATVYRLTTAGQLEHVRVGANIRVPATGLAAYLARRRSGAR